MVVLKYNKNGDETMTLHRAIGVLLRAGDHAPRGALISSHKARYHDDAKCESNAALLRLR